MTTPPSASATLLLAALLTLGAGCAHCDDCEPCFSTPSTVLAGLDVDGSAAVDLSLQCGGGGDSARLRWTSTIEVIDPQNGAERLDDSVVQVDATVVDLTVAEETYAFSDGTVVIARRSSQDLTIAFRRGGAESVASCANVDGLIDCTVL